MALATTAPQLQAARGIAVDYEVTCECTTTLFGVSFDVPETLVWKKRWVGNGPYRVWQNRLQGGVLDLHEVAYNNAVPGESYNYPEFSGYFSNWRWLTLQTDSGNITVENASGIPYFGLYRPPGGVRPILELPDVGLSLLSVITGAHAKRDGRDSRGIKHYRDAPAFVCTRCSLTNQA